MNKSTGITGVAIQELISQARSLGISWNLRLATVTSNSGVGGLAIIFDGDTVAISATNITGDFLASGDRVYVIMVPTTGNYVVGHAEAISPIGLVATVTAQALPNNAATAVSWASASFNDPGFISTFPSTSFTIPAALGGLYAITANTLNGATGARNFIEITESGNLWLRSFFATPETFCSTSGVRFFSTTASTTIAVNVFQNSGGATTMTANVWAYRLS